MDIVEESFTRLFPDAEFGYEAAVSYSGKFKPYNATVRRIGIRLFFSFSHSWMGVSDEIVIGLVQHLLVKILKKKGASTLNMQLYDDFIRGISDVAAVSNDNDEALESSFARVNERYFLGLSEKPNLRWGSGSFRKLASYDYHVNAITISSLFRDAPQHILDYLTYHELLHKKLKFRSSSGMTRHHGAEFRSLERAFEGSVTIDK
ncbi:TPA: hypothetical protein HA231_00885 [Candidatus Woesearchaeota archaeon]|nr:hypothetical protein [Candidatus Woesearchaeota archaeon]